MMIMKPPERPRTAVWTHAVLPAAAIAAVQSTGHSNREKFLQLLKARFTFVKILYQTHYRAALAAAAAFFMHTAAISLSALAPSAPHALPVSVSSHSASRSKNKPRFYCDGIRCIPVYVGGMRRVLSVLYFPRAERAFCRSSPPTFCADLCLSGRAFPA